MSESHAEEVHRLRNTMRDLVAFSTLPAVWGGRDADGVASSFAEILLTTLSLDLVYLRFRHPASGGDIEVVMAKGRAVDAEQARKVAGTLVPWLTRGPAEPPSVVDPLSGAEVRVAAARFGYTGDEGVVVACARRAEFPTEADRLLLGVGTNQTAVVLQRRRAERALAEERERLRTTLASIGDAVVATDAEGRVTFLNGVAESLTGWTQAEAAGRPLPAVFRIVNEHTREPVENPALRALREGVVVGLANHTVLIARDGTERPIDDSAAPMRDAAGAGVGAVLVFRDVTERKRAEDLLRRKEAELSDFVENATVGLHWVGPDGTILWANRAELELLGYARDEYVGRNIAEFHVDRPVIDDILCRLLNKEELRGYGAKLRCRDGSVRHVLINSNGRWEGDRFVHTRCFTQDVTDKVRADEAQARLAAIVESSEDAISSTTLDGVIRSWNRGAERLFGYAAGEAVGRPIALIIPPERRDEDQRILERVRRGERVEPFETLRATRDGRLVDVSLSVSPIRDGDGRLIGASKVARDVTRQKRAAEELRASEERYRTLFTSIDQGFCVVEVLFDGDRPVDYRFVEANPVFEQQTGLSHPVGRTARELVPDLEERWVELYGRVAATGEPARVVEGSAALGRWFDVFASRTGGPGSRTVAVLFTDVTDRKRAEAERERLLREVEAERGRLAEVFQSAPSFMCVLSGPDHVFERANDRYYELLGRSDIIGRTVREAVPEVEGQGFFEILDRVYRTGEPFVGTNVRVSLRRGGRLEERVLEFVYQPVRDSGGAVSGVLAHGVDLTERVRAEEEVRDADRKKDDFIALLAHELRNPLAPIRNGLQVIRLARGDAAAADRARAMMDRQLAHMVRLIDDLLDISRIKRNKMELRRSRILLADAISSAVETARPAIEAGGHELTLSLPPAPVFLDADLTRLAQVFSNLLTNSAKYTERGGRIRLSAEVSGGAAVVAVRDNGIGIPAEALPTIFDMFSQVDRSIERSTGGLGIGLALVKGLVEMHGGSVAARSEGPGRGSTFTVTLPALAEEPGAPEEASGGDSAIGKERRILVVDDNRDGAESLAEMLRLLGNQVRTAHDGLEAVEQAEWFRPDVILMDVGMPRLNGLDATRRIRGQPWGEGITIVALTGWGQEADRERSREAGCNGHLVKPVNLTDLEKLLGELRPK